MTQPLTAQQLDEATEALATYQQHPAIGFACCSAHPVADHAAALLAEVRRLTARVAELEAPAVYARAALAALCYDLEDPGSDALGALYELSRVTTGVDAPKDDTVLALNQYASEVLEKTAEKVDPEPPETSFFGDHGPAIAAWLRMLADRTARPTP